VCAGDSLGDPTWSPSSESFCTRASATFGLIEEEGEEASSALQELPRGTATMAGALSPKETNSEGTSGPREHAHRGAWGSHRAASEPRGQSRGSGWGFGGLGTQSEGHGITGNGGEAEGPGIDGLSEGASFLSGAVCADDREYYENVSDEGGESASFSGECNPSIHRRCMFGLHVRNGGRRLTTHVKRNTFLVRNI
jgi:hypothetical protein